MTNDQTAMLARYGIDYAGNWSFVCLYDLAARVTDALRANDIDSARTLMPDLRESHVAVLEALKNLEEWGLSTSMR